MSLEPASPTDHLVCRNEHAVYGFDVAAGKLLWSRPAAEHPGVLKAFAHLREGHFQPGWRPQLLVAGDGAVHFVDYGAGPSGQTKARVLGLDLHTGRETWQAAGADVGDAPHPIFYQDGNLYLTTERGYAGISIQKKAPAWLVPVRGWRESGTGKDGDLRGLGTPACVSVSIAAQPTAPRPDRHGCRPKTSGRSTATTRSAPTQRQ